MLAGWKANRGRMIKDITTQKPEKLSTSQLKQIPLFRLKRTFRGINFLNVIASPENSKNGYFAVYSTVDRWIKPPPHKHKYTPSSIGIINKLCFIFFGVRRYGKHIYGNSWHAVIWEKVFLEFETKMAYCPICHEFILRHKRWKVEMCSWRAALPYNSCNFTETAPNMWNVIKKIDGVDFFEFCFGLLQKIFWTAFPYILELFLKPWQGGKIKGAPIIYGTKGLGLSLPSALI